MVYVHMHGILPSNLVFLQRIDYTCMYVCIEFSFNSCNMGTSGLPDMYIHPRPEGVHIRQTTSAHVTTIM